MDHVSLALETLPSTRMCSLHVPTPHQNDPPHFVDFNLVILKCSYSSEWAEMQKDDHILVPFYLKIKSAVSYSCNQSDELFMIS